MMITLFTFVKRDGASNLFHEYNGEFDPTSLLKSDSISERSETSFF